MVKRSYAIVGATGQIGHVIVEHLIKKGHKVRALAREHKKLEKLATMGADCQTVYIDRPKEAAKAFEGVDAVFLMLPPSYQAEDLRAEQKTTGESLTKAVKECKIPFVVNLSSLGAHLPSGLGPITGLHDQEQRLDMLHDVNILHFRPAFFMDNLLWALPSLIKENVLKLPLRGDLPLPMVATEDIGGKVAEFLDQLNFKGHTVWEFAGPRSITPNEVAKVIGGAIGKPNLPYKQQPLDEVRKGLEGQGMKPKVIDAMIEMYTAFNAGKCLPTQTLSPDQKGKITLEQYAQKFATVYKKEAEKHKVSI